MRVIYRAFTGTYRRFIALLITLLVLISMSVLSFYIGIVSRSVAFAFFGLAESQHRLCPNLMSACVFIAF